MEALNSPGNLAQIWFHLPLVQIIRSTVFRCGTSLHGKGQDLVYSGKQETLKTYLVKQKCYKTEEIRHFFLCYNQKKQVTQTDKQPVYKKQSIRGCLDLRKFCCMNLYLFPCFKYMFGNLSFSMVVVIDGKTK